MSRSIYFEIKGIEMPLFMEVDLEGFDDPIVGLNKATGFFTQDNQLYAVIDGRPVRMRTRVQGFDDPIVGFEKSGLLNKQLNTKLISNDRLGFESVGTPLIWHK